MAWRKISALTVAEYLIYKDKYLETVVNSDVQFL